MLTSASALIGAEGRADIGWQWGAYISLYLTISHYISLYLTISHCVSHMACADIGWQWGACGNPNPNPNPQP